MRSLLLIFCFILPLSAEKVSFDDGRFTVEFPEGWKKAEPPQKQIVVHRESEDGEATFSISRLGIAKGRQADLHGTLETFITSFKASGMTVKGDPKGQESIIDGKKAVVATVPVELKQEGQALPLTFFMVLIEAPERLIVMQATLTGNGTNEQRAHCRKIIGSFEEHEVKKEEKPTEEAE